MKPYSVLGISGSLRSGSYNTALLHNLAQHCPDQINCTTASYEALPPFNPDHDDESMVPEAVEKWKRSIRSADALVIVTPEYAHAIPGALKNALDWIVGSGELVEKPVAALSASPTHIGPTRAYEQLLYLLRLLSADVMAEASFCVSAVNRKIDTSGSVTDAPLKRRLVKTVQTIHAHLLNKRERL